MKTLTLTVKDDAVDKLMALLQDNLAADDWVVSEQSKDERVEKGFAKPAIQHKAQVHHKSTVQDTVTPPKQQVGQADFYQTLMQWREENADILDDEDPWANVRSKEMGREFSWDDE